MPVTLSAPAAHKVFQKLSQQYVGQTQDFTRFNVANLVRKAQEAIRSGQSSYTTRYERLEGSMFQVNAQQMAKKQSVNDCVSEISQLLSFALKEFGQNIAFAVDFCNGKADALFDKALIAAARSLEDGEYTAATLEDSEYAASRSLEDGQYPSANESFVNDSYTDSFAEGSISFAADRQLQEAVGNDNHSDAAVFNLTDNVALNTTGDPVFGSATSQSEPSVGFAFFIIVFFVICGGLALTVRGIIACHEHAEEAAETKKDTHKVAPEAESSDNNSSSEPDPDSRTNRQTTNDATDHVRTGSNRHSSNNATGHERTSRNIDASSGSTLEVIPEETPRKAIASTDSSPGLRRRTPPKSND